ncbi:MAG: hypothetical protein EBT27_00050 [Betaproteobacteria bacterium]|nr:hypothetical protein [Betaproteobacteria bacterium]
MNKMAMLLCLFGTITGTNVVMASEVGYVPAPVVQSAEVIRQEATAAKVALVEADEREAERKARKVGVLKVDGTVFRHGDISWLPALAAEAGWPEETWPKLGQIILRESGGCPNRKGGDAVDKNCNVTRVTEWNHRSDTGLLQINGVNYDTGRNKWALICREMAICEQDPLLDPLTNLKAGKLLYDESGWGPWEPCTWDKSRCSKRKP